MKAERARVDRRRTSRTVLWFYVVVTLAGAVPRLWGLGKLGLTHFDEGIYALAGLWSQRPEGLPGLDQTLIAYAPPGFVFFVGGAYRLLGASDLATIVVSAVFGIAAVPLCGMVCRGVFGETAGKLAACFCAFSGFHVTYSRMALTDATLVVFWLLAIEAARRFLECPGARSGALFGLSVGCAQLVKYNGWLTGAFAIPVAVAVLVFKRDRDYSKSFAIGGVVSVVIAAGVYSPWFNFVERHGGYSSLLAHHRSYLGGFGTWLPHLVSQYDQGEALAGGMGWTIARVALLAAAVVAGGVGSRIDSKRILAVTLLSAIAIRPPIAWLGGWFLLAVVLKASRRGRIEAGPWILMTHAVGLFILTPFYHPYSRLMLPLEAVSWMIAAAGIGRLLDEDETKRIGVVRQRDRGTLAISLGCLLGLVALIASSRLATNLPGILDARSSLRDSARALAKSLPAGTPSVLILARPAVTFYLAGSLPVGVASGIESLAESRGDGAWAIADTVLLRQEGNVEDAKRVLLRSWEIAATFRNELGIATLLDVDPAAAVHENSSNTAELLLLRPRGSKR